MNINDYQDYYLKFADEQEMEEAFQTETVTNDMGTYKIHTLVKGLAVDVVGVIYRPTGEISSVVGPDGETMEIPTMAPLPGWHVNIRSLEPLPESLAPYIIPQPNNPARVWA